MDSPLPTPPTPEPHVAEQLDPDEVLKQEFAYARDTALQANNDRTQVVSLYVLLVGGMGSVLIGLPALARGEGIAISRGALGLVLFLIAFIGVFSVLKLIRLRQAWHDSVLAMNRIKDFYLVHFPELAPAFRWRTETIPPPGKPGTITFDLCVLVALIDSMAMAGGAIFMEASVAQALLAAFLFLAAQGGLYFGLLRNHVG